MHIRPCTAFSGAAMAPAMALTIALAGCSASPPSAPVCTSVLVFGLGVRAVSSTSGAPLDSATVTATDGGYVETAITSAALGGSTGLAGERPGTYAISVRKSGYAAWDTTGVTVTKDACHVHPVSVTARLTPAGS